MRRVILTVVIAASCLGQAARAQDWDSRISCHTNGVDKPRNRSHRKKLWGGYEISLGPARNGGGVEDACTAAIYNSAGRVVFRTSGFSVIFDGKLTGQDFDDDGRPEVVFITDTGGGMHCCWTYNVVSLFPRPHKLFDIAAAGAVEFERDVQGKMVIWQRIAGPYGFTSMAGAPFAEKVFRVRQSKLVDTTPEFCSKIFSDRNEDFRGWNEHLTQENIDRFRSTGNIGVENEQIVGNLLSRALQHVFCGQFDAALNDLNLWPEGTRAKMTSEFANSINADYPDFAARVRVPAVR